MTKERDSLADAERLRVDVLNTPASKRERELGAAIERLINEVKELREEQTDLVREASGMQVLFDKREREREQMEEALRFYADEANHKWQTPPGCGCGVEEWHAHTASIVSEDKGERARAALSPSDTERRVMYDDVLGAARGGSVNEAAKQRREAEEAERKAAVEKKKPWRCSCYCGYCSIGDHGWCPRGCRWDNGQ